LKRFSSQIDVFLNELGVSVRNRTHVEKISRIISELKNDTDSSDNDFENNDFENNDSENNDFESNNSENNDSENNDFDVENNNVKDNNTGDNKTENTRKNKILNYILQSSNKKTVAEFLVNIISSKFAQIRFRNLIQYITQIYNKKVIYNILIRLLCVRLRKCSDYRFRYNRLKKIRLR